VGHAAAQAVPGAGREDKVNMVGHQAIGNLHLPPPRLPGQLAAIDSLVAVLEEDRRAAVSALGDVVRTIRNDDAGLADHAERLSEAASRCKRIVSPNSHRNYRGIRTNSTAIRTSDADGHRRRAS
jgi:hypothetical protein